MIIDGVFSGGGIKGFAFIGALQVFEEEGIQFERVAGTSAGAIIATFIAAGFNAKEIEDMFEELDLKTLLDPPKTVFGLPFLKWINLYRHSGLYRGRLLENWFSNKLASKKIYTFSDLPNDTLKLIASDLTNGQMIILPNDLSKYGIDGNHFPVSRALRMSCGLPFFFEPIYLKTRHHKSVIVDGGVLSNFPLWIFDSEFQRRPVIGLKLSSNNEEMEPHEIDNAIQLFEALFSTMKDAHDKRYIDRKHARNIIFIPADKFSSTTQFTIDEETKQELIKIGRERTKDFLKNWSKIW